MKDRKPSKRSPKPEASTVPAQSQPELPAWKAFVVQFNRETRPQGAIFAGRIEHLSSGRRARFESPEDLLAALDKLLAEVAVSASPGE
jgi:hypothetical protein